MFGNTNMFGKIKINTVAADFKLSVEDIAAILKQHTGADKKSGDLISREEINIIFTALTKKYELNSFDEYFIESNSAYDEYKTKQAEKDRRIADQMKLLEQLRVTLEVEMAAKRTKKPEDEADKPKTVSEFKGKNSEVENPPKTEIKKEKKDSYIFISYAHKDISVAYPIIQKFLNKGYRIWYDEGIDPGTEWDVNIANHILDCGYFIGLISNNYLLSSNCKDELNFARHLEKKRFLIFLEDVELPIEMQMRLNRIQNIHKYKYDDEQVFYQKLFSADGLDMFKKA